ncbi:hypothetical protein [Sphingobium sp. YR768]|uniref:hypothetical protein n=1 Tax=Sphingobium sp. YR768 TaxID=1884365 RepID=UPI00115FA1FC|nr:hypothetical protein [Sphingobium sp. YR768]
MIDGLVASGIAEPVAEFLWDAISPYYGEGDILPHPDDDLATDAGIDSEDIEDMVADFFRLFALPGTDGPVAGNHSLVPQHRRLRALSGRTAHRPSTLIRASLA